MRKINCEGGRIQSHYTLFFHCNLLFYGYRYLQRWKREFLKSSFISSMIFFSWLIYFLWTSFVLSFLLLVFLKYLVVHGGLFIVCTCIRVKVGTGSWSVISLWLWEYVSLPCLSPYWATWSGSGSMDRAFPPQAYFQVGGWEQGGRQAGTVSC